MENTVGMSLGQRKEALAMKEILKNQVATMTLPKDHYLDQDAEIFEFFVEEIEEIFTELDELFAQWFADPNDQAALTDIRRHFHTLKGSGRMVGALQAGEMAWTVEDMLNRVMGGALPLTETMQHYAHLVFRVYQHKLYPSFKAFEAMNVDVRPVVLLGQKLQTEAAPTPELLALLDLSDTLTSSAVVTGLEDHVLESTVITDVTEVAPVAVTVDEPVIPAVTIVEEKVQQPAAIAEEIMVAKTASEAAEIEPVVTTTSNTVEVDHVPTTPSHSEDCPSPESTEQVYALDSEYDQESVQQEILKPLTEPAEDDLAETVSIFIEEADEHLSTIMHFITHEHQTAQDYNELIRALHTLRGSSSMAHLDVIFEASSKVERLFKSLLQEDILSGSNEIDLLDEYAQFIQDALINLRQGDRLLDLDQTFNQAWEAYQELVPLREQENLHGIVSKLLELDIDLLLDTEVNFVQRAQEAYPEYLQLLSEQAERLTEHATGTAAEAIQRFAYYLQQSYGILLLDPDLLQQQDIQKLLQDVHEEFIHLFDTLAIGQRVVISEYHRSLMQRLDQFLEQYADLEQQLFIKALAEEEQERAEQPVAIPKPTVLVDSVVQSAGLNLAQLSQQIVTDRQLMHAPNSNTDFDADLVNIFLEEAEELLVGIDHDLNTWSKDQTQTAALSNLMRHLHTLKGGANMVQATYIGTIAHELESIYERLIHQHLKVSAEFIQIIRIVQDDVADRIQIMQEQHIDYPAPQSVDILKNIHALAAGAPSVQVRSAVEPEPEPVVEIAVVTPVIEPVALEPELDVDAHVRESFLEEAGELLPHAEQLLKQWVDQRSSRSVLLQLQRVVHTLKGGARMVQLPEVEEISYQLENAFEQFAIHQFSSNAYDELLLAAIEWLKQAIFSNQLENYTRILSHLQSIEYVDVNAQLPSRVVRMDLSDVAIGPDVMQGDGTEPPSMLGEWADTTQTEANNEMIRISADLVEKMIDLSGENSINRSRIEMDLGRLGNTLNEMELTILRLADQLRRMEGELESQILAKHSQDGLYDDFDPLEMDQYSSLNQLSKSLSESASDLVDFKVTLSEKIRDAEGLLLQQSRIQTEIQESLMRTRLVPVTGMLPRLQRIVRQTSSTLNRPTELVVKNTEGELDRTILERLVTPFEHMLRNAVDHGIESPELRSLMKKPAVGQIELNITRQGTDVIVSFSDDGRGIDVNKIRDKALKVGLIKPNQALDTQEIMQLIFHPGFSTAKEVTQISGRGVGLDIVQSEIKVLGGHISVDSVLGSGTTFSIRVPTTVAISDALMVKVGDQQFSLPLSQIERIVRVSPTALENYFNGDDDFFEIEQQFYKLRYLAEFIAHQPMPRLQNIGHSLPVLLIKSGSGQTTALLVDQLIGSRAQIVVKSIGQQFSKVGAIAGATIMGDGHVCLILDGQNIARQIQVTQREKKAAQQREMYSTNERKLIMIVDDSVTVRKVTSRLLERQGYEIITAKDGLDAVEQLESVKPDLMLLDIEMPRMDGFEVTNLVRHHDVHHSLPIIMITSRTGEKHRERAYSLGVSGYMGKPFQEAELVAAIQQQLLQKEG